MIEDGDTTAPLDVPQNTVIRRLRSSSLSRLTAAEAADSQTQHAG